MAYDYHSDPILGRALTYWTCKRGGRRMPRRQDIDPADIPRLLPNLQLIDVLGDRYRYRLIGTALVEAFGRDYTGKHVDELFTGSRGKFASDIYGAVRMTRRPLFLRNRYLTTKDVDLIANRLYLPLSEDDREVSMILGALTFEFGADLVAGAWGSATLDPCHVERVELGTPTVP